MQLGAIISTISSAIKLYIPNVGITCTIHDTRYINDIWFWVSKDIWFWVNKKHEYIYIASAI